MSIGSVVSFPHVGHGVGQKFLANPQSNFLQQKIPKNRSFLGFLSCVDKKDAWAQRFAGDIGRAEQKSLEPLRRNGSRHKMTPPNLNNDNSLFKSGRVIQLALNS